MNAIWDFFCSRKLVLVLIALIITASIFGTVVQQNAAPGLYVQKFGEAGAALLIKTGITDLYHCWWFIALLVLLTVNTVVCSLDRIGGTVKLTTGTKTVVDDDFLKSLKLKKTMAAGDDPAAVLQQAGYKTRQEERDGTVHIMGQKGILSRYGSFITHCSLVVIFAGAITGALLGFKSGMNIAEGETLDVPHTDWKLHLEKFEVEFYEKKKGMPKDYKSTLTLLENGKPAVKKIIEVNDPLIYKGVFFYQASYGQTANPKKMTIAVTEKGHEGHGHGGHHHGSSHGTKHEVGLGGSFPVEDGKYSVTINRFEPDFFINENKQIGSRSRQLRNPAVHLAVHEDGKHLFSIWSFKGRGVPHFPQEFKYNFLLTNVETAQYSGLQVVRDPGVPVVWAGCLIMVIGLIISFYMSHRRIWVQRKDGQIIVGGTTNRNPIGFEKEFNALAAKMNKGEA